MLKEHKFLTILIFHTESLNYSYMRRQRLLRQIKRACKNLLLLMICLPLFKLQAQVHRIYSLYGRYSEELFAWHLQTGRCKLYYVICYELFLQMQSQCISVLETFFHTCCRSQIIKCRNFSSSIKGLRLMY